KSQQLRLGEEFSPDLLQASNPLSVAWFSEVSSFLIVCGRQSNGFCSSAKHNANITVVNWRRKLKIRYRLLVQRFFDLEINCLFTICHNKQITVVICSTDTP